MVSATPDILRVIVVTLDPGLSAARVDSPAAIVRGMGHHVVVVGYDLTEVRERGLAADVLIIEAGAHLEIGRDAIKRLRAVDALVGARVLLCVDVTRVAGLDPEIGADDFLLMPIIPRELSARLRQLGWREIMGQGGRVVRHGGFVLDCVALQASYRGEPLKLTPYEFQLLEVHDRTGGRGLLARGIAHPRMGLSTRGPGAHRRYPHPESARQAGAGGRSPGGGTRHGLQAAQAGRWR